MHVIIGSLYLGLLVVLLPSWTASLVEAAWLLLLNWRFGGGERKRGEGGGRGGEGERRRGGEEEWKGKKVERKEWRWGKGKRRGEGEREGIKRGKYLLENEEDLRKFPFNNHVHSRRDFSVIQDLNIEDIEDNGSKPCCHQS